MGNGMYQAYDRLTALTQQIGQYKEARRQREIDEKATGMLLQGAPPEQVEQFLVNELAPERRSGLAGLAERLVGGTVPRGMSPMQQQVVGSRMQRAFPTPGQKAQEADASRAGELHNARLREIDANIRRLELMGDPNVDAMREVGSVLGNLTRNNLGEYDAEIKNLTEAFQQLVTRVVDGQRQSAGKASQGKAGAGAGASQGEPMFQMQMNTPPELQQRIQRLLRAGAPIEAILDADEVKPYVIRKK